MGGFVVTLVYGFSRATGDLDVLKIASSAVGRSMFELGMRGGPLHKKYKIYLDRVGVAKVPELERNIERDRDDVKHLAKTVPFDLEVLKNRYQKELRWQLGNPEREDLTLRLWMEAIEERAK